MQITLNHGSGGRVSHKLISELFLKYFQNNVLSELTDSAILGFFDGKIAFTTDSYVVDPIFFPGGNIGKLAICGTVNDLSVAGAVPKFLSVAVILEEGLPYDELETIISTMSQEALKAGVTIVTGDTKVVPKGKGDKIYITTSGIGILDPKFTDISYGVRVKPGDKLIINGNMGDHAIAILAARESLRFETSVISDCAALNHMIQKILEICPQVSFMRDITRGGLATVANELAEKTKLGIRIYEENIPLHPSTMGICEIFGFDPLFLANEGKILIVAPSQYANDIVNIMKDFPEGENASVIGEVVDEHPSQVILQTLSGGKRLLEMPSGIQLPRIC
ncbi:MAG: hydrogenase expression/formation protein HypE [Bacteroidales bacterium]|nr:hydrogenase expression/formation protein HypE [Bacteroidales bacterium]